LIVGVAIPRLLPYRLARATAIPRFLWSGATRGLGFEIARGMAEAGAIVGINGRDPARAGEIADDIKGRFLPAARLPRLLAHPGSAARRAIIARVMRTGIETGFLLDQLWHLLRGEMDRSKEPALLLVGRIFSDAGIPYAIIGGVALQIHQPEPRTTLDIDLAVLSRSSIPRARLEGAGFAFAGQFTNSENWLGPGDTPVQLTDDPALAGAIRRAEEIDIGGVRLRVIGRADLLHEKLRAASDPAPRRSKRLQDLADAHALIEASPDLVHGLSTEERASLDELPG
jgi:hypothetical protein